MITILMNKGKIFVVMVEISTEMPDDIESEEGCYNFTVSKKIICPLH